MRITLLVSSMVWPTITSRRITRPAMGARSTTCRPALDPAPMAASRCAAPLASASKRATSARASSTARAVVSCWRYRSVSRARRALAATAWACAETREAITSPRLTLSISTSGVPTSTASPAPTSTRVTRPRMRAPTSATWSGSKSTEPTRSSAGARARVVTRAVWIPKRRTKASDTCTRGPPSGLAHRVAADEGVAGAAAADGPTSSRTPSAPAAQRSPKPSVASQRFTLEPGGGSPRAGCPSTRRQGGLPWDASPFAGIVPRTRKGPGIRGDGAYRGIRGAAKDHPPGEGGRSDDQFASRAWKNWLTLGSLKRA